MIIGITGTYGAGKGAVVEHLVKVKGFKHLSVGGFLAEEVKRSGGEVNRQSLINAGNRLRNSFGAGYLVEELLKRAKELGEDVIIESIRTEGEVEKLKKSGGILFGINADRKTRYERIVARGSEKDKVSFEEFCESEDREMESADSSKQNLKKCLEMADFRLENDGSLEELHQKVEEILNIIKKNDR